jgi:hypothetical protein
MQNRIDRLEGLVLSLMSNGAGSAGPGAAAAFLSAAASTSTGSAEYPHDLDEEDNMIKEEGEGEESDVEQVRKSFGFMKVDKNHSFYVADSHWVAILSDVGLISVASNTWSREAIPNTYTFSKITEVRNYWMKHKKQYEEQMIKVKAANELHGTPKLSLFLSGAVGPTDKSELLSAIPSRALVDKLIVRYFNSYDPVVRKYIIFESLSCCLLTDPHRYITCANFSERGINFHHFVHVFKS